MNWLYVAVTMEEMVGVSIIAATSAGNVGAAWSGKTTSSGDIDAERQQARRRGDSNQLWRYRIIMRALYVSTRSRRGLGAIVDVKQRGVKYLG